MEFLEFAMETCGNTTQSDVPLVVDPETLEGVASAYRYKLTLKNESLLSSTFSFNESMDVFSFAAVDKKRALKKDEWPSAGSHEDLNRYDVKVQLMAGNVEIQSCDGCASWKEKTRKPFLVLTPNGERCVHFQKQPFLLLIFRCCPKFHSCNKQFRLVITLTSRSGEVLRNEVNIYRKKMVSSKKRRCQTPPEEPIKVQAVAKSQPRLISTPPQRPMCAEFPLFEGPSHYPMSISTQYVKPMPIQAPQYMVSSQIMYDLLYDGKQPITSDCFQPPLIERAPVMKRNEVFHSANSPFIKREIHFEEPRLPPNMERHLDSIKDKVMQSNPIRFDFFRPIPSYLEPAPLYVSLETNNDERWLDSVFSEIGGAPALSSKTIDDLSALLDLPDLPPLC
eukprot:TRINITY_DN1625_c0_g1_i1.p1 TRINITY_DN1625_c0_g1~~TRINITY_DN1625_c0_g1_i1.p1  ORF type:complete len:393 (+),score=53.22 TRINITY_DN1625_c0_g1_i1:138-1316(+)